MSGSGRATVYWIPVHFTQFFPQSRKSRRARVTSVEMNPTVRCPNQGIRSEMSWQAVVIRILGGAALPFKKKPQCVRLFTGIWTVRGNGVPSIWFKINVPLTVFFDCEEKVSLRTKVGLFLFSAKTAVIICEFGRPCALSWRATAAAPPTALRPVASEKHRWFSQSVILFLMEIAFQSKQNDFWSRSEEV